MKTKHSFNKEAPLAFRCSVIASVAPKFTIRFAAALIVGSLFACGKASPPISTADRVKIVEEKQKADPNFHLKLKAGDASAPTPKPPVPSSPPTAQVEQTKS